MDLQTLEKYAFERTEVYNNFTEKRIIEFYDFDRFNDLYALIA